VTNHLAAPSCSLLSMAAVGSSTVAAALLCPVLFAVQRRGASKSSAGGGRPPTRRLQILSSRRTMFLGSSSRLRHPMFARPGVSTATSAIFFSSLLFSSTGSVWFGCKGSNSHLLIYKLLHLSSSLHSFRFQSWFLNLCQRKLLFYMSKSLTPVFMQL
jgi:hypothetical protein